MRLSSEKEKFPSYQVQDRHKPGPYYKPLSMKTIDMHIPCSYINEGYISSFELDFFNKCQRLPENEL